MWINIYKFLHILSMLCLCALILFNTAQAFGQKQYQTTVKLDALCFVFIACLYLTGAALVMPKGFTFSTPWIQAAFAFISILSIQIGLSIYLKLFNFSKLKTILNLNYTLMLLILVVIIHDAVTKHTLW